MQNQKTTYYPTTIEAIHLLVLYTVLQALVDFPLALYDYNHDSNWLSNPWISFFSSTLITAFIFIFGFRNTKGTVRQVLALNSFNPLILLPILILLPSLQFLIGFVNQAVDKVLPAPPWFWELFERILNNHYGFWGAAYKVVVVAPIVEETLFRGIIMYGLMRNYKSWYAILLSGILFSLFHLNPWQMTYTFFLGILLGWLMVRTKSLPLTILAHALNNLIVLISISFPEVYANNLFFKQPAAAKYILSTLGVSLAIGLILLMTKKKMKLKAN